MSGRWPKRRMIHAGRVVNLGMEPVTLPDGTRLELEVVRHPGGAAVVALDENDRVCLLRQWRHAAGGWLWELPAGRLEPEEPPLETARRELEEEAGLRARRWEPLGEILTTPGFCDEVIHLFLARDLTVVPQRLEHHECLEVHWLPFEEARAWIRDGRIRDAKTLAGLCLAQDLPASGEAP